MLQSHGNWTGSFLSHFVLGRLRAPALYCFVQLCLHTVKNTSSWRFVTVYYPTELYTETAGVTDRYISPRQRSKLHVLVKKMSLCITWRCKWPPLLWLDCWLSRDILLHSLTCCCDISYSIRFLWAIKKHWCFRSLQHNKIFCLPHTCLNYFNGNLIDRGAVCLSSARLIIFTACELLNQSTQNVVSSGVLFQLHKKTKV